jgi:hypothetical protein
MTAREITDLGSSFAGYRHRFRKHLGQDRTADLCDTSCRGLLSGLRRKCIEPVAPEAETAVRTFQEFLGTAHWNHPSARDTLRAHLGGMVASLPADPLGIVGVIDETNCCQWGDHTPGVQRQYLGGVGKIENGIVTVHSAVAPGTFHALLDADLDLPPAVGFGPHAGSGGGHSRRPPAPAQVAVGGGPVASRDRQRGGVRRRGRGSRSVVEVPEAGRPTVRGRGSGELCRPGESGRPGPTHGRAAECGGGSGREHTLVAAGNEATGEVKYFLTNVTAP